MMRLVVVCLIASAASAFAPVVTSQSRVNHATVLFEQKEPTFDMLDSILEDSQSQPSNQDLQKMATATSLMWMASATAANADSPDWGLFEGRTGSLLHPIMMGSLLLFSLNTGFKGWQWRRQRTMGDEITALKKELSAIATPPSDDEEGSSVPSPKEKELQSQIDSLTSERKELSAQGNRDKHFSQGALLAFLGTAFAIEGPLNTYARAGKLFPGPHLYAGAGLVVCWAAAAACVPAMQKGNDTARSIHIGANAAGIGLFGWQLVSGFPILQKVIEKTSWP